MKSHLDYNLHSHTARCGHAIGLDYEYIDAAIEAGIKHLGFSDHIMLPGIVQEGIRGDYSVLGDYLASTTALRDYYKEKIKINIGFEAEWYGDHFREYYEYLLSRPDVEYMILGQHCFLGVDGRLHWYESLPREFRAKSYCHDLVTGMDSGLFTYVAHPDLYIRWNGAFDETAEEVAHEIARAAVRNKMPLEINCGPSRYRSDVKNEDTLSYPCPRFWDVISRYDVDVVIGVDAHNPKDYEITDYDFFMSFVSRHGLRLLRQAPELRKKK